VPSGFPDYFLFIMPIGVNLGGTGTASFTANGVLLGNAANPIQSTSAGAADQIFRVPGAGGAPAFGAVDLAKAAAVTGVLALANGGTGTATPALVAGTGIQITGSWPNSTITNTSPASALGDPVTVAHGGTGTTTPALAAGANIAITGTWPNQTVAFNGLLPVASGGTGTATPSLLAGTNIAITGTWPNQQVAFSGLLAKASGGTGTATPALLEGTGITITGEWPGNTIALTTPVAVSNGGTGTATGSITGTGALTFAAGGTDQSITLTPSGAGWVKASNGRLQVIGVTDPIIQLNDGTYNAYLRIVGGTLQVYHNTYVGLSLAAAGAVALAAGGSNQNVTLTPSGTGGVVIAGVTVKGSATAGQALIADAANSATWTTPDGARVYNDASQTIGTSSLTALTFNSERYDNGGLHSTVTNTNRLTAQKAGKYLITAHIEWSSNTTGVRRLYMRVNGSSIITEATDLASSMDSQNQNLATIYHLAASGYVELQVYQSSGVDAQILADGEVSPEFAMQWLGP